MRRHCAPTLAEADRARDDASLAKAHWYAPFAHITSLRMRSDDEDGGSADSPTASEDKDEGGDAVTSDRNRHMSTSA